MVERRRGGETGVQAVQLLEGEAVWRAGDDGRWSWELLAAALARAPSNRGGDPRQNVKEPYAFLVDYRDGLRATALMLNGQVGDYLFAARLKGRPEPISTHFWNQKVWPFGHSVRLNQGVEEMFLTGAPTWPIERTLLTTGILAFAMDSRFRGSERIETPELAIAYRAT
jgi:hypothetical protein